MIYLIVTKSVPSCLRNLLSLTVLVFTQLIAGAQGQPGPPGLTGPQGAIGAPGPQGNLGETKEHAE